MNKTYPLLWTLALLTLTCIEVYSKSIFSGRVPLKIVNGTVAAEGEFPYEIQLLDDALSFMCGGSIIGDKWILTAGHCVSDVHVDSIAYGTNVLYEGKGRLNNTILVKKSYLHPKYTMNSTEIGGVPVYDVGIVEADFENIAFSSMPLISAMGKINEEVKTVPHNTAFYVDSSVALKLSEPIPFSKNVQPIKLADVDDVPFHVDGFMSGWGVNSSEEFAPQHYLHKLQIPLLTDEECSKKIATSANSNIYNASHNVCSDYNFNGICYGDSGSPFVINGIQYGVTSWMVPPCASSPSCFSRITNPEYRAFIKNVTGI